MMNFDRLKGQYIFGKHPIEEALNNQVSIDKILMVKSKDSVLHQIAKQAYAQGIPVQFIVKERLESIFKKSKKFGAESHQGVIAFLSYIDYHNYQDIIDFTYSEGKSPFIVLLDGVTDVRNFGAIARSALGFNVDALVIPDKGAARINAESMKTSAGALNHVPVCRVPDTYKAVEDFKLNGLQIVAAQIGSQTSMTEVDWTLPTCLLMGAEDKGVSDQLMHTCDTPFIIPMNPKLESLNVSVASAIIMQSCYNKRIE